MRFAAERTAVADACRQLAAAGLVVGTAGNVSLRIATGDGWLVAVSPTGARLGEVSAGDVPVVDPTGTVVAGSLAPTSELALHLALHGNRPEPAIVHTHSPAAIGVGLVRDELPTIHYAMLAFGGAVRVAPYATFGTDELAAHVLGALPERSAALMANHGAVALGATLDAAVESALLLEWVCDVYLRAAAVAEPRVLDASAMRAVADAVTARGYGRVRSVDPSR